MPGVIRLANELTPSSHTLRKQIVFPIWAVGFSHLRLSALVVSIFANSHVVHDMGCKTEKPAEQRTVICDAHDCFLII